MNITLNGESRAFEGVKTIEQLLEALSTHPKTVVVERNGEIVRRPQFEETDLAEGDVLEVVRFFPGG